MSHSKLTYKQKLNALAFKYYQNSKWEPKAGDYYTTSRADLELYRIAREDDQYFYTTYLNPVVSSETKWPKDTFLKDFGLYRVYVPEWIFELEN